MGRKSSFLRQTLGDVFSLEILETVVRRHCAFMLGNCLGRFQLAHY